MIAVDPYPPDEETRFGVYELRGREPVELARTSRDGLGLCLVTLAEDRREAGQAALPFGVLDKVEHKWIAGLWHAKEER